VRQDKSSTTSASRFFDRGGIGYLLYPYAVTKVDEFCGGASMIAGFPIFHRLFTVEGSPSVAVLGMATGFTGR